uniref:Inositol 2-dehydrogenase n=1 Tax=Timspurckia oligopyrenoides TaxID=708627 RepID=A0A7S0ZAN6_9RHOD|mmetsp:Transcript_10328/g.18608  ORF Transcript_10328/g.18608 Transcript_10328/m.18608 type:complete len:343 (+) Transcript_10328:24-1052(+)
MDERLRVGVIGCGRIGQVHLETLVRLDNVNVVGVVDVVEETAKKIAEKYAISSFSKDPLDIFDGDPKCDAVWICTPTFMHVPLIKQAAERGIHVFCEKPLALSVAECNEAIEAVKQTKIQLMMGFQRRFDHGWALLKSKLNSGELGELCTIGMVSRDPEPAPESYLLNSGGIWIDMAIHDLDAIRFLMGKECISIYAQGAILNADTKQRFQNANDVDTTMALLTFEDNKLATLNIARKGSCYDQRCEVTGTQGVAKLDNVRPDSVNVEVFGNCNYMNLPMHAFMERYKRAYARESEIFVDCLLNKKRVPTNANDGKQAFRLALAASMSMKENRIVRMSEIEN